MPQRARWRTDDGSGTTEFLRYVLRETVRPPRIAWLTNVLVFFGPPLALAVWVGAGDNPLGGAFVGLLGLCLYAKLIDPIMKGATRRPLGALGGLLPLPLPAGTFPVTVTIRHGNTVTGIDEAAAAFVEGWLHVEGKRTSFSLRAVDGRAGVEAGSLKIALPEFQTVVLDLVRDRGLDVHPSGFAYVASHWVAARESPEGEAILPPLRTLPLVSRGWNALGVGGFLAVLAVQAVRCWTGSGPLAPLATVIAVLGAAAFCRALFMTKGHEEGDRRAHDLGDALSEAPVDEIPASRERA